MPFLKKLVDRGHFEELSFYSGLPSTTPAVQAEVMFGARCAVPAFQFLDRESGKTALMYEQEWAKRIGGQWIRCGLTHDVCSPHELPFIGRVEARRRPTGFHSTR